MFSNSGGGGSLPPTFLNIPEDIQFSRHVSACERFSFSSKECPYEKMVGVHDAVAEAKDIVMAELPNKTAETGGYRVPPLVISRLARGGKTTALCLLFDALKAVKDMQVNVMMISFNANGSSPFKILDTETQTEGLIRNIASQLVDPAVDPTKIKCTAKDLDEYIGDSPFVILIDELNAMANPVDEDAGRFLRSLFLDKENRYLVFTTHVPMDLDPKASHFMESGTKPASPRGVRSISLPTSNDLTSLRLMPGCENINPATVALYGGIPSLIYSVCALNEMTPEVRFRKAGLEIPLDQQQNLLLQFVKSVVTGERNDKLKMFEQFATTNDTKIQWPICYIQYILNLFEQTQVTRFLIDECQSLETYAKQTEAGKDWECVINISLGFRCLYQLFFGSGFPFKMVKLGTKPEVSALSFPCKTVAEAKSFIDDQLSKSPLCLLLAVPSFAKFPEFDGFVVCAHPGQETVVVGFQAKLGSGTPKYVLGEGGVTKGVLLRGAAPAKGSLSRGWEYWSKKHIQNEILVYSLRDLYPENWSQPPNAAAAEERGSAKKLKSKV